MLLVELRNAPAQLPLRTVALFDSRFPPCVRQANGLPSCVDSKPPFTRLPAVPAVDGGGGAGVMVAGRRVAVAIGVADGCAVAAGAVTTVAAGVDGAAEGGVAVAVDGGTVVGGGGAGAMAGWKLTPSM